MAPRAPITCYQCDADGVYVGAVLADPNPREKDRWMIPAGAVETAPPAFDAGTDRARWDGSGWVIEPIPEPEGD